LYMMFDLYYYFLIFRSLKLYWTHETSQFQKSVAQRNSFEQSPVN